MRLPTPNSSSSGSPGPGSRNNGTAVFPDSGLTDLCLQVEDCAVAVDFYTAAFGGHETMRECLPDGHILYAEVAVSCYLLRLSEPDAAPAVGDGLVFGVVSDRPETAVPAAFLQDPFGHRWSLRFVSTAS